MNDEGIETVANRIQSEFQRLGTDRNETMATMIKSKSTLVVYPHPLPPHPLPLSLLS